MTNLIKMNNITKSYQVWNESIQILKWINIDIKEWSFVSIMWQSGSWKSTLMNIIWMLDTPTDWTYLFNWKDVSNLSQDEQSLARRENIGFIFQTYNLIPRITVLKQVMLPLMYQWIWAKERKQKAIQALEKVWLLDKINNYPTQLSWWQQQRVSIARAIVTSPKLILWDEPTWALDSKNSTEVMEIISWFHEEWKTVIIITHDKEIDSYAKEHIIIRDWLVV